MSRHILIVDADALLRYSLAFALKKVGYRVSTAATGEDALCQIGSDPPDLVLLDVDLPGMGWDAIRRLRRQIDAPVVFLATSCHELCRRLGIEPGGDGYIIKPFDIDRLLTRVEAVLGRTLPPQPPARERAPAGDW